ncbi:MAG: hypothetical protein IPI32_02360 [Austwickia sp.]|nr:hypothetical protein [Austwickia sp.]MBK8437800.1 hypothetical protein [Austwickia sp.]MBK9100107.1 hypothetical protein [Austwickia sp.]
MVTAEFAVALPIVIVVLALALTALMAAADQLRCVDAARVGARAAARGDTGAAVHRAATWVAPTGSTVTVVGQRTIVVHVSAPPRPALAWLPVALRPQARATAIREVGLP